MNADLLKLPWEIQVSLACGYAAYVVADAPRRAAAIDAIVRLVLSHVMQPGGTVEHMTDNLTAIAAQLLGATARSGSGQPRIREPLGS